MKFGWIQPILVDAEDRIIAGYVKFLRLTTRTTTTFASHQPPTLVAKNGMLTVGSGFIDRNDEASDGRISGASRHDGG